MNAERLHAIVTKIKQDLNKTGLIKLSQQVLDSLQKYVNNQQNSNVEKTFSDNLSRLYQKLDDSEINEFSPAWLQLVEEIGGLELLGNNLKTRIEEIFARNQITPSVALDEFKTINNELNQFNNAIDNITGSFNKLNIGKEELEPGECELGILVPRNFVDNKLNSFGNEIDEIDFIVKNFEEVTTGKREDISIKTISSSDLMLFLDILPQVGACLAVAIERIIALYKQILEIRKLHTELENQGIPEENLEGVKEFSNTRMSEGIGEIIEEIMDKYYQGNEGDRKNEIRNSLKITLNKIANRVDKGFNFEIRIEKEEPEDDGDGKQESNEDYETIVGASKELRFLKLSGNPILSLPEKNEDKD